MLFQQPAAEVSAVAPAATLGGDPVSKELF
jgi:hypothetical protein